MRGTYTHFEIKLRQLGRIAAGPSCAGEHVDGPVLALLRSGDLSDDLADAMLHVAHCCDCRARLTEGEIARRAVVVMAIEAPKRRQGDLAKAAHDTRALLKERGDGRWTAVVDAEHSESFLKQLEADEGRVVSRFAATHPVEVPVESMGRSIPTGTYPAAAECGTDAAEVQAWATVARVPRQSTRRTSAGWTAVAIATIAAAAGLAYLLALR